MNDWKEPEPGEGFTYARHPLFSTFYIGHPKDPKCIGGIQHFWVHKGNPDYEPAWVGGIKRFIVRGQDLPELLGVSEDYIFVPIEGLHINHFFEYKDDDNNVLDCFSQVFWGVEITSYMMGCDPPTGLWYEEFAWKADSLKRSYH